MNTQNATIAAPTAGTGTILQAQARAHSGSFPGGENRYSTGVRGAGEYCRRADPTPERIQSPSSRRTMKNHGSRGMCPLPRS